MVIDLKVFVRNFNYERRMCYVGNPRENFFRVCENKILFCENWVLKLLYVKAVTYCRPGSDRKRVPENASSNS